MAILPKGKIKAVMPVLKDAGIFGATMFPGKGMCTAEGRRALGLRINSSREILMLLTLDRNKDKLITLLEHHGTLKDPGQGIVFVMDISQVIG
ncbi:MAG TPA: P-II family nitrogen regulator [Candidatus Omnitrophota bacterium]|nr:P-II family nitrogen regulator [Candidatus Omnitrophota bacterium]